MTKRPLLISLALIFGCIFLILWTQLDFDQTGTIKIWDKNKILLYESAGSVGKKVPITYSDLPEHLINAVVASEDVTFWTNPGIDLGAILRSLFLDIKAGRIVSGASTITQQVARTSIISPQKKPSRSVLRKFREILIALRITAFHSKMDILTMYLNQMYFGNLSYGIQAASNTYFGKSVSQLSLAESALLVGLLSSPDARDPFTNINAAKKKQSTVLDLMVKNNFISVEKSSEAKQEPLSVIKKRTDIKAPHFVHFVLRELNDLGIETSQGITVYTVFDYSVFKLSEDLAKLWVERLKDKHDLSNAALVLLKNDTGEILNMLGGVDYFDATHSGQVNMTTALRQPGSALKPVTYAAAFMQGYTPATLIYDVKKVYQTKKGEGFTPNNYDGRYHGLVLAREALASSLNLPAVEMLNKIGINSFLQVARGLGISSFNQEERYDLSLTLGGGEVKLLELTNVFSSFARGGNFKAPYAIQKIVSDSGKLLYFHHPESGTQVLGENGEQIAFLISDILSDPKARIPGFSEKNPLVLSRSAAVKTGTTTDWHDNWTVGYTPSYTVGVWVGNNDNHPMREISGVVGAAPLWNQFFEEFLKGKPIEKFSDPGKIVKKEVCALSGVLPDGLCPEKTTEIFLEGTEPQNISTLYKKITIDKRNNFLADSSCPKAFIEEKIFVDYPPEVYTWAVQNSQPVIPRQVSPFCNSAQPSPNYPYLEITTPKEKTIYETAPTLVSNEAVVFEVNVSPNISRVVWYLDGKYLREVLDFPYRVSWKPLAGQHTLKAVGLTSKGDSLESREVGFTVVKYRSEY